MNRHRIDFISLVLGIGTIIAGIAAANGRLGNLVNDRPDALLPLIILGAGLVAIAVAARRSIHERHPTGLLQDVDGAGDDQHHRAE